MGKEEESINRFRELINDFKTPYLEKLDAKTEEEIQDVDHINDILKMFDSLYRILRKAIENGGGAPAATMDEKAVLSVFEKKGFVRDLKDSPGLKEKLLYYLNLDLKTYPFTRSIGHIKRLEENHVQSFQSNIISNLE